MSWFERLKTGLKKSSSNLTDGISAIFTKTKLDNDMLEELEDLLIQADLGVRTASHIIKNLAAKKFDKEISTQEVKNFLAEEITARFNKTPKYQESWSQVPKIVLVCGVNGNGKTTTIGKLTNFYQQSGKRVMIAACDTFRAAAVEQLEIWADRCKTEIIKGAENADPASVAHKAVIEATKQNVDLLLIDTAGRLHNKTNLMDELKKIRNVIAKINPNAPHETIIVIDATTGQNAITQVEKFKEIVEITGIIITKLDGTAKAGVVLAIAEKFMLPIIAIGVGEQIDDLQPFDSEQFARNLV